MATVPERTTEIDLIAQTLPRSTGQLTRIFVRYGGDELPRAMASTLSAVSDTPRSIGHLAAIEAVAQPTATRTVERLESLGLAERRRDEQDGRVVLVHITDEGRAALQRRRSRLSDTLRERLQTLSDEQLDALVAASQTLHDLAETLRAAD